MDLPVSWRLESHLDNSHTNGSAHESAVVQVPNRSHGFFLRFEGHFGIPRGLSTVIVFANDVLLGEFVAPSEEVDNVEDAGPEWNVLYGEHARGPFLLLVLAVLSGTGLGFDAEGVIHLRSRHPLH